jgi:hypothetical protein
MGEQELKFFKLDTAPLGIQETFKSAPMAVKIPTELLDWVRSVLWEYVDKGGTNVHDLFIAIRTKAIANGYSSQQIMATNERATVELHNRNNGGKINRKLQKLTN